MQPANASEPCGPPVAAAPAPLPDIVILNLTRRYQSAYRASRILVGLGTGFKVFGLTVWAALVLAALDLSQDIQRMSQFPAVAPLIGGLALGLLAWLVLFVLGTLLSSQGQILKATLDTAVCSSTFLSNEHRAKIMSLL